MSAFLEKINSSKPTLVDFYAVWCGPCKMMEPALKSVHEKLGHQITFLKVDIDKNPGVGKQYQIQGVPTLILFREGKIIWRQSGAVSAQMLEQALRQHIQL
jgi:thioredoxin 1